MPEKPLVVDFSRIATQAEADRFGARVRRLEDAAHVSRIDGLYEAMRGVGEAAAMPTRGLVLRPEFSYRAGASSQHSSDRKAPPSYARPPATRIQSSRGSALTLALNLYALAQMTHRPGHRANLPALDLPAIGTNARLGWADLVGPTPPDEVQGRVFIRGADKRARSMRSGLLSMEQAGLVRLGLTPSRREYNNFILFDEDSGASRANQREYTVPTKRERTFQLPREVITKGWLHALEDSEIAVLLMARCGDGGWRENGFLVMPGSVRLSNYGIHRGAYSLALKTLQWFGLLDVQEVHRHPDGRAIDEQQQVHRLRVIPEGFAAPALPRATAALRRQLERRTA